MLQKEALDPVKHKALIKVEKHLRHQLRILDKKIRESMNNIDSLVGLHNPRASIDLI